jgi:hypothetical protein
VVVSVFGACLVGGVQVVRALACCWVLVVVLR